MLDIDDPEVQSRIKETTKTFHQMLFDAAIEELKNTKVRPDLDKFQVRRIQQMLPDIDPASLLQSLRTLQIVLNGPARFLAEKVVSDALRNQTDDDTQAAVAYQLQQSADRGLPVV